jgi:hypothetical protein
MHRHILRIIGVCCTFWLLLVLQHALVRPGDALALSPRPTLAPIARPTLKPVTKPVPGHTSTPVPTGRITGTVIDLSSGAPVPDITVRVGNVIVTADANGNYDRSGLPVGIYPVALVLNEGQGTAAQEPQQVQLAAGATVIIHLNLYSRVRVSATPHPNQVSTPIVPRALPRTGVGSENRWQEWYLAIGSIVIVVGVAIRLAGESSR